MKSAIPRIKGGTKRDQEFIDAAIEAGLVVDRIKYGKHLNLYVTAADGRTGLIVAPISASDHERSLKTHASTCRKFARGVDKDR
jgi:hypothetical protein